MENLKFVNTDQKIVSENYPYGFREKTTKTDYLEFSPKHGFRHCSQTINPKTGRPNNPKKSTYYDVMVLGTNEDGHCKSFVSDSCFECTCLLCVCVCVSLVSDVCVSVYLFSFMCAYVRVSLTIVYVCISCVFHVCMREKEC